MDRILLSEQEDLLNLIFDSVKNEIENQDNKWGPQNHGSLKWNAIMGEERGECEKAILENEKDRLTGELIQVIAVAVQWLACELDRTEIIE